MQHEKLDFPLLKGLETEQAQLLGLRGGQVLTAGGEWISGAAEARICNCEWLVTCVHDCPLCLPRDAMQYVAGVFTLS